MDRDRFNNLLQAYGADFARWPVDERVAGQMFAAQNAEIVAAAIADAHALDAALNAASQQPETAALTARILAAAPKAQRPAFDRRAMIALAACAVFGVVLGYGGGLLAPVADEDNSYFADAFEAPLGDEG